MGSRRPRPRPVGGRFQTAPYFKRKDAMEIQPQPQIFDVDEQNFEELVLQGSQERVIVVDFWAPWCGPCKTLGPILEDVVAALGPGVALAKVNVDENQRLAMAFGSKASPRSKSSKTAS